MRKIMRRIGLDLRKKTSSWLLKIAVFTMLFSLLFTSILIYSVSNQINENIISRFDLISGVLSNEFQRWYQLTKEDYFNKTNQYLKVFNELGKSEGVDFEDINFELDILASVYPVNMKKKPIEFYSFTENLNYYESDYEQYKLSLKCLENKKGICIFPSVKSVRNPNFIDLKYQRLKIVEGRTFTEQELLDGANVCIVKKDTTIDNGVERKKIKIGDLIPISEIYYDAEGNVIDSKLHELEVIGLYHPTNGINIKTEFADTHIPFYVPEKLFNEYYRAIFKYNQNINPNILSTTTSSDTYRIFQGIFGFNTLDHLRIFLDDLEKNEDYYKNEYKYFSTADQYYISISNVMAVSDSFDLISKICFVICLLITIMIVIFDIIKRRKEIGILLSLGSSMKEIIIQFVIELMIITSISFAISFFLSSEIAQIGNQYLFESTLESLSTVTSSIDFPSITENMNQEVVVNLIKPQITANTIQLFVSYIVILLLGDVLTSWQFIRKIDPIELLKDE